MLRDRPQGSPTFKSRSLGYPELELAPLLRKNENIGGGGSTASTFGTENTSFATGWPIPRPIAKSEEDWSTALPKCITSESSAGAVENQNGIDLIPGDELVLARFRTAHDDPSAVGEADTHPAAPVRVSSTDVVENAVD
jgi:hypothetical protein